MNYNKNQIERFLREPDQGVTALLFYGPDQGLAHERAQAATRIILGGTDDPFRLTELTAETAREDPARLADELNAIAMLGGRRVVRIQPAIEARANDALAAILAELLPDHDSSISALLVVEAGDLPQRHALVQAFETAPMAIAARCFHDSALDLRPIIVDTLRQAGHEAARGALDYLVDRLGGDRGITRSELQKLCLYVGSTKKRIELTDAIACIGDQAEIAQDDLMMAIAEGDLGPLERCFDRCLVDADAVALLRAAGRYFLRLHLIAGRLAEGESFESVAPSLRPPLFWAIKARVERQCRHWDPGTLAWALERLIEGEARAMRHHEIGATIARCAFRDIALRAGRARAPRAGLAR